MIDELEKMKLIQKYEGSYVLTRKGQVMYGDSDPRFWEQSNKTKAYDSTQQGIEKFCEVMGLTVKSLDTLEPLDCP